MDERWVDAFAVALIGVILFAAGFALGYVSGMQRQLDELCSTRAGHYYLQEECE